MIKSLIFAVVILFAGTLTFAHAPFDIFEPLPTPHLPEPEQMSFPQRLIYYQSIFNNSSELHATYIGSQPLQNRNYAFFNACWVPITAPVKDTKDPRRHCESIHNEPISRSQLWWIQKKLQAKRQLEMLSRKPNANYLKLLELVSAIFADPNPDQYWLVPAQQAHDVLVVMAEELN